MIILTDKKLVIPVGIAPNYAGAGNSDIKLQSKSVTITENGSKTLFPDGNYDGFSQVNINTNVPNNPVLEDKSVEISENGDYRFTPGAAYDGIGNFRLKVNVATYEPIPVESVKTAYPSFENDVTVVPSEGFEAMSSVIVKKAEPNLQDKTVNKASTSEIVLRADEGYQGLGTVTVAPIKTKTVSADPSTNVQEFSANTENNEYITSVTVNPVNTTSINVDPSTNSQVVNASENEYITSITVNPVGTKTVTLDSSTIAQTVNANTEGNEYITSVTVNPVKTKSLSITPRLVEQTFTAQQELYNTVNVSAVKYTEKTYDASTNTQTYDYAENNDVFIKNLTINPVTASIDSNIVPGNIRRGVRILGVEGEVDTVSSSFDDLVNTFGAAITVKMKVNTIYREKYSDSEITVPGSHNENPAQWTSDKDVPGYIRFFEGIQRGTLSTRGIIAYAINGELHRITIPADFYIPYTKYSNGADDVTVDVYIDFEKSGKWCAKEDGTSYDEFNYGPSYGNYYLPPTVNGDGTLFTHCTINEIIVRNNVNSIGMYSLYFGYSKYGNLIFEPCVDGIKKFSQNSVLSSGFENIYVYGNINDISNFINGNIVRDFKMEVYGNISNYPNGVLTNADLFDTKFHGTVTTEYPDDSGVLLYKSANGTVDFYEEKGYDRGYSVSYTLGTIRMIIPSTCMNARIYKIQYDNDAGINKFIYNVENEEIVFFSKTPPKLDTNNIGKLSINDPSTNNSNLKRVFIPKGSNYDSILREAPFRPEVIEFTPITDLSTITVAGYYGYIAPDGSHTLLNVATTSQAESDIETIATEINNL